MKFKDSFHTYAIITILFWSLAFPFTKLAMQCFSAFSLGFLRYLIASLALIVLVIIKKLKMPAYRDLPMFALSGAAGFFLYMIAFNQGQDSISSATASVILATVPILTALIANLIYREKLKVYQWLAIGLEFIGVTILTMTNGSLSVNSGMLWMLVAVLLLTLYNLLQKTLTAKYSGLQASSYSIFFGTVMLAIFAPRSFEELGTATAAQLFYLAVLGLGSSAIAYVSWAKAFSEAEKTSQVSNYMFVTPFLATLMGFLIMNEVPDSSTLLGGAVIISGVLMFNFGSRLFNTKA